MTPRPRGVLGRSTVAPRPWGSGCTSYDLVDNPGLIVVHELMPPGTSEVRHVHEHARQVFFVLSGMLTIERGGETFLLRQHDALEIEPGTPHVVRNASESAAEFLAVASPTTKGDRIIAAT